MLFKTWQETFSKLAIDVSSVSASQQQVREEMAELSKYVEGELKKIGARVIKLQVRASSLHTL
jgi:hypothetical protein